MVLLYPYVNSRTSSAAGSSVGASSMRKTPQSIPKALLQNGHDKTAVRPTSYPACRSGRPHEGKADALMLADLGVVNPHSRPHNRNDNPSRRPLQRRCEISGRVPKNGSQTIDEARTFWPASSQLAINEDQSSRRASAFDDAPNQIHFQGQASQSRPPANTALTRQFLRSPERSSARPPKPPQIPTAVLVSTRPEKQSQPSLKLKNLTVSKR